LDPIVIPICQEYAVCSLAIIL